MSVIFAETYSVRFEKMDQLASLLTKASNTIREKPEKFRGLKSYQVFSQMVGRFGSYVEMWEFETMNDIDALFQMMFTDEDLKKFAQEFFGMVESGSYTTQIWKSVTEYKA